MALRPSSSTDEFLRADPLDSWSTVLRLRRATKELNEATSLSRKLVDQSVALLRSAPTVVFRAVAEPTAAREVNIPQS